MAVLQKVLLLNLAIIKASLAWSPQPNRYNLTLPKPGPKGETTQISLYPAHGPVVVLSGPEIMEMNQSKGPHAGHPVIVAMYASWCPHCWHLVPSWITFAEAFNHPSEGLKDKKIEIGAVNCADAANRDACDKAGVGAFPDIQCYGCPKSDICEKNGCVATVGFNTQGLSVPRWLANWVHNATDGKVKPTKPDILDTAEPGDHHVLVEGPPGKPGFLPTFYTPVVKRNQDAMRGFLSSLWSKNDLTAALTAVRFMVSLFDQPCCKTGGMPDSLRTRPLLELQTLLVRLEALHMKHEKHETKRHEKHETKRRLENAVGRFFNRVKETKVGKFFEKIVEPGKFTTTVGAVVVPVPAALVTTAAPPPAAGVVSSAPLPQTTAPVTNPPAPTYEDKDVRGAIESWAADRGINNLGNQESFVKFNTATMTLEKGGPDSYETCTTFTCALWTYLHMVTTSSAYFAYAGSPRLSPGKVMEFTRFFVAEFLTCDACRHHFLKSYDDDEFRRSDVDVEEGWKDLVLWLWRVHQGVSLRTAARDNAPVDRRWPSYDDCQACWQPLNFADTSSKNNFNMQKIGEHSKEIDTPFDLDATYDFIVQSYVGWGVLKQNNVVAKWAFGMAFKGGSTPTWLWWSLSMAAMGVITAALVSRRRAVAKPTPSSDDQTSYSTVFSSAELDEECVE